MGSTVARLAVARVGPWPATPVSSLATIRMRAEEARAAWTVGCRQKGEAGGQRRGPAAPGGQDGTAPPHGVPWAIGEQMTYGLLAALSWGVSTLLAAVAAGRS